MNKVKGNKAYESMYFVGFDGTYGGDVMLSGPIELLPSGLKVTGNLGIFLSEIKELPNDLKVGGKFSVVGNPHITSLPEGFEAKSLVISGSGITELPDVLVVGEFGFAKWQIRSLPRISMEVGNSLTLDGEHIEYLPEKMHIHGDLILKNLNVTKLPSDLFVKGNLTVENTPITELPPNFKVGGSISLEKTQVFKLPNDLTVDGDLNLRYCPITHLPYGLKVKQSLDVYGTQLTYVPDDLIVGYKLFMGNTPLSKDGTFVEPVGVNVRVRLGIRPGDDFDNGEWQQYEKRSDAGYMRS